MSPRDENPEVLARSLGRAIRVLRTERGLNRKELAEASGVSYPYLSEIEAGKKQPSSKVLMAIGRVLEVSPSEFMALAESRARGEGYWSTRAAVRDYPAAFVADPRPDEVRYLRAPSPPAAKAAPGASAREALLGYLMAIAQHLPEEDIERLLDLARRLRGDN